MPHDDIHAIHRAMAGLSVVDRVATLAAVLIDDERAPDSIAVMIEICRIMARHLPPSQQAAVVWYLNAAAAELDARWQ